MNGYTYIFTPSQVSEIRKFASSMIWVKNTTIPYLINVKKGIKYFKIKLMPCNHVITTFITINIGSIKLFFLSHT